MNFKLKNMKKSWRRRFSVGRKPSGAKVFEFPRPRDPGPAAPGAQLPLAA